MPESTAIRTAYFVEPASLWSVPLPVPARIRQHMPASFRNYLHQQGVAPDTVRIWHTDDIKKAGLNTEKMASPIVLTVKLDQVKPMQLLLASINDKLSMGGVFVGCFGAGHQKVLALTQKPHKSSVECSTEPCRSLSLHKSYVQNIHGRHSGIMKGINALLNRMQAKGRTALLTEMLGRLVYSGFEVLHHSHQSNGCFFMARKVSGPNPKQQPSYGPFFTMQRTGQQGRLFRVYKLRTMYPYAEYLQTHLYKRKGLQAGYKVEQDFRITPWGNVLRKYWLDELPMLINWLKGDVKLVGVRPLSQSCLNLYPDEAVAFRSKYKPGLIPPFYADLPNSLAGKVASEMAYLHAYEEHPIRTDLRYFFKVLHNIFLKGTRSQ